MSHTPGEWSVWTTMDNTLCIHAMQAPGRPIIAHVEPIGKRKPVAGAGQSELDAPGDTPSDEEIANAQLIAASPALLAACKLALRLYADARRFIPSLNWVGEEHHRITEVEDAIAKVEGKEATR